MIHFGSGCKQCVFTYPHDYLSIVYTGRLKDRANRPGVNQTSC